MKKKGGEMKIINLSILFILLLLPVILFAEEIKPGVVITKDNYERYLPELESLLPESRLHWFLELGLKKGLITVPIVETKYYSSSPGFIEATKRNRGKSKVGPNNNLLGWLAGVPFPDPKNAVEIAWNAYPEISHATSHDDAAFPAKMNFFSKEGKYEKHFSWKDHKKKYMGRTDIPPIPNMPKALAMGIWSKEAMFVTEPHDVKGFVQMRVRYREIEKNDDVYCYLPVIRRIRRLTGKDVCDPLLGSDMPLDDFETFRQKIDSKMTFKLLGTKKFIVPATYTKYPEPFCVGPCFQINWEIRPLCIISVTTNNPDYMYSKRILYIDTEEGHWVIYWAENYDQGGRLWRALGVTPVAHETSNGVDGFRNLYGYVITNCQTNHYTIANGDPEFIPLDPDKVFSMREMIKRSR